MTLNAWAEEIHRNAVEHGWWDEERTFGRIKAGNIPPLFVVGG